MSRIIFQNARVIDGANAPRSGVAVVLEGERIASVQEGPAEARPGDREIDLAGRTLMPGLISCHYHSTYDDIGIQPAPFGLEKPPGYLMLLAARNLRLALDCGFTSVVSAGEISADIDPQCKQAIEDGLIEGPRLVPGGRGIDVPSGYSDAEAGVWWWRLGNLGAHRFASGPEGLREAVREEMKHGVEIIKIFPSGGHATELPHTGVSLTDDELFAICDAAHRRGARVRAHCPAKEGILACLRAGVDIIDHGDEIDEECIERMLEQGTSFVPSMYFIHRMLEDTGNLAGATSAQMAPVREAFEGIRKMLPLANAEGLRIVIGDDYGVNILSHGRYAEELAFYVDVVGIPALDVIRWATRNGAELMGRGHELGGVAPGMLADLLVVDGDPATEITVLQDPSRIRAILTGGIFHKDLL